MSTPVGTVAAALLAGSRAWDFRYEAINADAVTLRTLDVIGGSVANNDLADKIKRTCRVQLASTSTFDQIGERLRIVARLRLPDLSYAEFPLGVFMLSSSTRRVAATAGDRAREYEGFDLLLVLSEDMVTARYVVTAGTNYVTAIGTLLTSAGFSSSQIVGTSATLPADLEWPPGTPKLTIINALLAAINYTTLSMTSIGVPTAQPYVDPNNATALWAYNVDASSVIRPGIDVELDLFGVPNVWIGVVSQPGRAPLMSTYTNSDPASPTSTAARGRSVVRFVDNVQDAVDQATLDALVARAADADSRLFEQATFSTALMPFHESGDVLSIDDGTGTGPRSFREHSWEIELKAGGSMKHVARRVVNV
jgi:hypothetical protein